MSIAALSTKRNFDSFLDSPPSSGNCRNFQKRCRMSLSPPRQNIAERENNNTNVSHTQSHRLKFSHNPASVFNQTSPSLQMNHDKFIDRHTYKKARIRAQDLANVVEGRHNSSSATNDGEDAPFIRRVAPRSPPRASSEMLFTLDQVKSIVAKALEEKETKLRQEYDQILQEKLMEQYQTFVKHNDDMIHRQMTTSTYNYMS